MTSSEPIRTLKYRPHLKWIYYAVLWIAAILLVSNIVFSGFLYLSGSATIGLSTLFVGLFISVLLWAEARYLLKPMAFAQVQVFADKFVIDRMGKLFEVAYSNIAQVKLSQVPYVGGWFSVVLNSPVNGKKSFKFTVVLERSEVLLDAIHKYSTNLFSEKSLESYRRTAVYSDHSWARLYAHASRWPLILLKFLVLPVLAGITASHAGHSAGVVLAPVGFIVYGYLVFLVQEIILGYRLRNRLKQNPNDLKRDAKEEEGVITKCFYVYGVGAVIGFILIFI